LTSKIENPWIPGGFVCPDCGKTYPDYQDEPAKVGTRTTGAFGMEHTILVCETCAEQPYCKGNANGIHGEVIVLAERFEDGWGDEWFIYGDLIVAEVPDELHGAPAHQVGKCANCDVWFFWSAKKMQWVIPNVEYIY